MKENKENTEEFAMKAAPATKIISRGQYARSEYGHRFGSQLLKLTKSDLRALESGQQMAVEIMDGEYVLFIEAQEEYPKEYRPEKLCYRLGEFEGSAFLEFQSGHMTEDSDKFKLESSLYVADDAFYILPLEFLFHSANEAFDMFETTVITKEQWEKVCELAENEGGETRAVIAEINEWAQGVFQQEPCFTVRGV